MDYNFKHEKLWCALGGAAAVIAGNYIIKSPATRKFAVNTLAKGMMIQQDAKETLQNMKDEASDICNDAKVQAGILEEEEE